MQRTEEGGDGVGEGGREAGGGVAGQEGKCMFAQKLCGLVAAALFVNSQNLETTEMPFNGGMSKPTVVNHTTEFYSAIKKRTH